MRCRQQSWLTTLLQLALCWSHSPTAAWARSHSTSKCRGARENVVCLGIPNLLGRWDGCPGAGCCHAGLAVWCEVVVTSICPIFLCQGQEWGGRQRLSSATASSAALSLLVLLLQQLHLSHPGCASSTCTASQQHPEALGCSSHNLQEGQASRLEDTGQRQHPLQAVPAPGFGAEAVCTASCSPPVTPEQHGHASRGKEDVLCSGH